MWWFDSKNGYGVMKYKNGKIEKGVFKDNLFVKAEDFDFELMQKTFKNWYQITKESVKKNQMQLF